MKITIALAALGIAVFAAIIIPVFQQTSGKPRRMWPAHDRERAAKDPRSNNINYEWQAKQEALLRIGTQARILARKGQPKAALDLIEATYGTPFKPKRRTYSMEKVWVADLYIRFGQNRNAEELLRQIVFPERDAGSNYRSPSIPLRYASLLSARGKAAEAERVLNLYPSNGDRSKLYQKAGEEMLSQNRYPQAKLFFQSALRLDPNNQTAQWGLKFIEAPPRPRRNVVKNIP